MPDASPPPEGASRGPASLAASAAAARVLLALVPYVKGLLRWCGVAERDVPDVAQDVVIQVLPWWSARTAAEPDAPPELARAYLRVTALRSGIHHCQKGARRRERLGFEPDRYDEEGEGEDEASAAVRRSSDALWAELDAAADLAEELAPEKLAAATDPVNWRIFCAWVLEEIPVKAIAEAEGTAVSTIYARLRAARRDLRAAVQRLRAANRRK